MATRARDKRTLRARRSAARAKRGQAKRRRVQAGKRQTWVIPRNKRRMTPAECAMGLRVGLEVSGPSGSLKDQETQDKYSQVLDQTNLKKGGAPVSANSGGFRTCQAQDLALGLSYLRRGALELELTQDGAALVEETEDAVAIIQRRLLVFQYPSPYSMGPQVNMDERIKVRPFIFLLRLANDPDLNGLTADDIMVAVVHGRTADDFGGCKRMILEVRRSGIRSVIKNNARILTVKTRERSYPDRLNRIRDVANTFKSRLIGAGMVDECSIDGVKRIFPKKGIMKKLAKIDKMPLFKFSSRHDYQAIRQYGKSPGKLRDTRRKVRPDGAGKAMSLENVVRERFLKEMHGDATERDVSRFLLGIEATLGIRADIARGYLEDFLLDPKHYAQAHLVSLARGGLKTAGAFEDKIGAMWRKDLGFTVVFTGRKKSKEDRIGGFADHFVMHPDGSGCGLVDAKATDAYSFPHEDVLKMLNTYIPSTGEIECDGKRFNQPKFLMYISHTITKGAVDRARSLHKGCGIPVVLCSVYGWIKLTEDPRYKNNPTAVMKCLCSRDVLVLD